MEQEVNAMAPFLLIQKQQELIRVFESLIDKKIGALVNTNISQNKSI